MTGTNSDDYANHAGQIGLGVAGNIRDAQAVVQAWLDSPMHRGTVLNPDASIQTGCVSVAQKALSNGGSDIIGTSIIFDRGISAAELDQLDWSYENSFLNIMPEIDRAKVHQYLSIY